MNRERKIETEEVESVAAPPRARVTPELERKRDYLAGFLAGEKPKEPQAGPESDLQASVVDALKSIYDPEIPVDIYELGLIYDVDIHRHDADDAALPRRGIASERGRAAGALGSGNPRRSREPRLGSAVGPVEDERRSETRIGNAVMTGPIPMISVRPERSTKRVFEGRSARALRTRPSTSLRTNESWRVA